MSDQSPTGAPQPPKEEAYTKHSQPNPMIRNLSEYAVADTPGTAGIGGSGNDYMSYHPHGNNASSGTTASRTPFDGARQGSAMPQPQERGVRGGKPTSERERRETHYAAEGKTTDKQNDNEDAEQMATYAEGKVADAVQRARRRDTSGSPHGRVRGEISLSESEGDLERKKAQQEVARRQVMEARKHGENVDGRAEENEPRKPVVEV
ncbi:hypothetical protein QBC35DRAFT_240632 [Podospora australis]|uniref:Uncharacterized protein n=1 Tax=Podospora australis TaxID=1536484 RepID=A0AAN6WVS8_9PEZI|nr:hypothetical protein QBC35DRAFT_240632 [Podospora australis]